MRNISIFEEMQQNWIRRNSIGSKIEPCGTPLFSTVRPDAITFPEIHSIYFVSQFYSEYRYMWYPLKFKGISTWNQNLSLLHSINQCTPNFHPTIDTCISPLISPILTNDYVETTTDLLSSRFWTILPHSITVEIVRLVCLVTYRNSWWHHGECVIWR